MMAATLSAIDVNRCQFMPPFPVGGSAAVDVVRLLMLCNYQCVAATDVVWLWMTCGYSNALTTFRAAS